MNCPTNALEGIVDDLKEELQIYKDGDDGTDDFEPFQVKAERKSLPKVAVKANARGHLKVRRLQLELPSPDVLTKIIRKKSLSLSEGDRAAPGRAVINVVSVRTGDVKEHAIDLFETMRIQCGVFLQQEIRRLSKNCLDAIDPALFTTQTLAETACFKSKALDYYRQVAIEIVRDYENHVRLAPLVDDEVGEYVVDAWQPSGSVKKTFKHAAHSHYDSAAFNNDELEFAKALDSFDFPWARNKDRLDYGIPLPMKSGASNQFYPDFLWWVKGRKKGQTVWAIDTTGRYILDEKLRTKLLTVPEPLRIALVVRGKMDANYREESTDGWSVLRHRVGNARPETFDELGELLKALVAESGGSK